MSYKKQQLHTLREHLSSPRFFDGVRVAHLFSFLCCPIMCLYVLSSVLWCLLRFSTYKRCSFRLYLHLFVWGLMSYLRYLYLFPHSGIQPILRCVFVLFFFVMNCLFLISPSVFSNVYFWFPLRYSLMFIYITPWLHIIWYYLYLHSDIDI